MLIKIIKIKYSKRHFYKKKPFECDINGYDERFRNKSGVVS